MERKIMILSDSIDIRDEAVQYSMGLAERLDAFVVLLLLLDSTAPENRNSARKSAAEVAEPVLSRNRAVLDKYRERDITAELWVKVGDPASEFIKFMAGAGSYQAIIWGGDNGIMGGKSHGMKGHWLLKIKDLVDCPLVAPTMRHGGQ